MKNGPLLKCVHPWENYHIRNSQVMIPQNKWGHLILPSQQLRLTRSQRRWYRSRGRVILGRAGLGRTCRGEARQKVVGGCWTGWMSTGWIDVIRSFKELEGLWYIKATFSTAWLTLKHIQDVLEHSLPGFRSSLLTSHSFQSHLCKRFLL